MSQILYLGLSFLIYAKLRILLKKNAKNVIVFGHEIKNRS